VEAVDESETGSANFFGPAHVAGLFLLDPFHVARMAVAMLEKENCAICGQGAFRPLDRLARHGSVLLAPSTERE
jgi:hypothetical protein